MTPVAVGVSLLADFRLKPVWVVLATLSLQASPREPVEQLLLDTLGLGDLTVPVRLFMQKRYSHLLDAVFGCLGPCSHACSLSGGGIPPSVVTASLSVMVCSSRYPPFCMFCFGTREADAAITPPNPSAGFGLPGILGFLCHPQKSSHIGLLRDG